VVYLSQCFAAKVNHFIRF